MPLIGLDKVHKAVDKLVDNQNKKVRAVYVQGLSSIIKMTPVHFKDGGRLRNNWFLTTQAPSNYKRGKNAGGGGSYSSLSAMPSYVLNNTFYFTNNMPYARVVEYGLYPEIPKKGTWTGSAYQKLSINGFSRQAPAGMVRINLLRMRRKL